MQITTKIISCINCGKTEMISGTLEGVSFVPSTEIKKWFASGVYGIKAIVCRECGHINNLTIDTESLTKVLKDKTV